MGNLTFAVGLVLLMIGITYGIEPMMERRWVGAARL